MSTGNIEEPRQVDPSSDHGEEYWDEPLEGDYDDFDKKYRPTESSRRGVAGTRSAKLPYMPPATSQTQNVSPQGKFAKSGSFPAPGSQKIHQYVKSLQQQGYSLPQIQQKVAQQFGETLPNYELEYLMNGSKNFSDPSGKYMGYNPGTVAKTYKSYGNGPLDQYFQDQLSQEAWEGYQDAKKQGNQQKVKMHKIMMLIMMGDITGAVRAYAQLMDRDLRKFSREVIDKLQQVRSARSKAIRNFAHERPPRAYAGTNPQASAHAQDMSQRYNQFVQLNTQLMSELQNTERELMDVLQTLNRDVENMWQSYATMRDNAFRVDERLMTIR